MFACTSATPVVSRGESLKVLKQHKILCPPRTMTAICLRMPVLLVVTHCPFASQGPSRQNVIMPRRAGPSRPRGVRVHAAAADAATVDNAAGHVVKNTKTKITVFSAAPYVTEFLEGELISPLPSVSEHRELLLEGFLTKFKIPISGRTTVQTPAVVGKSHSCSKCVSSAPLATAFENVEYVDTRLGSATAMLAKGSDVVCLFVNDHWRARMPPHFGSLPSGATCVCKLAETVLHPPHRSQWPRVQPAHSGPPLTPLPLPSRRRSLPAVGSTSLRFWPSAA